MYSVHHWGTHPKCLRQSWFPGSFLQLLTLCKLPFGRLRPMYKKNYLPALFVCKSQDWGSCFALARSIGPCDSWKDFPMHAVSQLHLLQFEEPLFLRTVCQLQPSDCKKNLLASQSHNVHSTQISARASAHRGTKYKYVHICIYI
jgi:hypothetical protein